MGDKMTAFPPNFKRIEIAHAYRQVADAIEARIVSGSLKPGDPIGTESDLVRQFGVNRSTVREGIRVLEESGLIRRESNRRLLASVPHAGRLKQSLSRAFVLHEITFRELHEAATILDTEILVYAVERASSDEIETIAINVEQTKRSADAPAEVARLDDEFHRLIASASKSGALEFVREPLTSLIYRQVPNILRSVPEATERLIVAHERIFDALRKRDKDQARLWMRRHAEDWRKGFTRSGGTLEDVVG